MKLTELLTAVILICVVPSAFGDGLGAPINLEGLPAQPDQSLASVSVQTQSPPQKPIYFAMAEHKTPSEAKNFCDTYLAHFPSAHLASARDLAEIAKDHFHGAAGIVDTSSKTPSSGFHYSVRGIMNWDKHPDSFEYRPRITPSEAALGRHIWAWSSSKNAEDPSRIFALDLVSGVIINKTSDSRRHGVAYCVK
jgi:hypothetical protein